MNALYKAIGISKQAAHQYQQRQTVVDQKTAILLQDAQELRREHPGCGVEKMYYTLRPDFLGRDRFIELFMDLGLRLAYKKNYRRTTFCGSIYYPNLIKGYSVSTPNTIWQTDITYIYVKQEDKFYYAVFIIDVYTKKIVGHKVSGHMRATANKEALLEAIKDNGCPRIHHSDRGSQYSSLEYTQLLKSNNIDISMALSAQDNAYAERVNKTIKEEYLDYWKPKNYSQLKSCVAKAVTHYNTKRKHNHLDRIAPADFETMWYKNELKTKPIFSIFDKENNLKTVNTI